MELASISQSASSRVLEATGLAWTGIWRSGKLLRSDIVHATQSLMHWTKLTAVFSGLLGAGGLFGINRMAASVAGQRTSAAGLGISYGEQANFLTNFGRLGNAEGILQGFSEAETDVSKKYALRQYLGHAESDDPARDFAEGLGRFKNFVDQYKNQNELLGPALQARGYDKLGIGIEQARIAQGMSAAEIAQLSRGYRGDLAGRLGLSDTDAKKWAEFSTQMEKAGREIETVFAKGAIKLAKPLEHLSESFIHLTENLLKDGSPIAGWIKGLGKGLQNFADTLGTNAFQAKASKLGQDVADVVKLFDAIIAKYPTALAIATGSAGANLFRGTAAAIGGGLARSGAVGSLGAGAAAAGALGATVYPQPLNEGEDKRARQRRFHQGSGGPPMPPGVFPERVPAKPGSLSDRSAIWLDSSAMVRIHHPRRYQGHMKVGDRTFDYASGSENRGRGSSPFRDHPITEFDPSAMHGRGGGAFRARDVFDPQTGDRRGVVEIHMSRQEDISRVETAGCFGIPQSEWGGAKTAIQRYMRDHGGATLRVYPNGNAEVVPSHSRLASYALVKHGRRASFGHPHVTGHHPATIGRVEKTLTVEDHTGGMVTVVPQ
jgi:hypothetical protein